MAVRKQGNFHDGVVLTKYKRKRKRTTALSGKQERAVRSIVNDKLATKGEKKYHDLRVSTSNIPPYTGIPIVRDISLVTQGTGAKTRIGDRITPQYLGIRGYIHTQSTGQDFCNVRLLVIQWWSDSSTEAPNWSKILADTNFPCGYYNKDHAGEFKVLHDERLLMTQTRANPTCEKELEISIKGNVLRTIHFDSGTSSGANHIYFMAISDDQDASVTPPVIQKFNSRLIYTDC